MTVIYTWELPERLADLGGWTNRDCASWMAEYASVLFDRIGDRVDHWLTMCEPMSVAHYGYVVGELAPGIRDLHAGLRATHNVLLGHGRTVEAFRASDAKGDIGIINGMADIRPATDDPADVAASERVNAYYHALYLDPIVRGEYPSASRRTLRRRLAELPRRRPEGDLDADGLHRDRLLQPLDRRRGGG